VDCPERHVLVTFAVSQESRPFRKVSLKPHEARILLTGIGRTRARAAVEGAMREALPGAVISSGFAGGLNPVLPAGAVVCDASDAPMFATRLRELGARTARFHTADRVVATPEEKAALARATHAEAVDMESESIRGLCRERGVPFAIVRVISDAAQERLPLDFGRLLKSDGGIRWGRMALEVARDLGCVRGLLRLQRTTRQGAARLARVIEALLRSTRGQAAP
jgi:nucleoside phosphorylase